jgi:hypothetical protein
MGVPFSTRDESVDLGDGFRLIWGRQGGSTPLRGLGVMTPVGPGEAVKPQVLRILLSHPGRGPGKFGTDNLDGGTFLVDLRPALHVDPDGQDAHGLGDKRFRNVAPPDLGIMDGRG